MSNHSANRVSAGVRTGGQFATTPRVESEVGLMDPTAYALVPDMGSATAPGQTGRLLEMTQELASAGAQGHIALNDLHARDGYDSYDFTDRDGTTYRIAVNAETFRVRVHGVGPETATGAQPVDGARDQ